jgi:hypothetical protein
MHAIIQTVFRSQISSEFSYYFHKFQDTFHEMPLLLEEYLAYVLIIYAGNLISEGKADKGVQSLLYTKLRELITISNAKTKQIFSTQFLKRKDLFLPQLSLGEDCFSPEHFNSIGTIDFCLI